MRAQYEWSITGVSELRSDASLARESEAFAVGGVEVVCRVACRDEQIELALAFRAQRAPAEVAYRVEFVRAEGAPCCCARTAALDSAETQIEFALDLGTLLREGFVDGSDCLRMRLLLEARESAPRSYAGLKNQGTTCYMNSLLQSLFHIPAFRRIVYEMPTDGTEDAATCIPLNLQRLFCQMQVSAEPCSTKALTKSFGWGDMQTIMQHDIQEFCRVLLDNLETKMKGTDMEKSISNLFRGQFRSFIRCKNVEFESSKIEDFYDLTLIVKNCKNLRESFEKYTEIEEMTGANQYSTEEFGKQDAEMGVEFVKFPPILHLHLSRFEYDYDYGQMIKINDRFEFPEEIDLSEFLAKDADKSGSNVYQLFDVLVHMGDVESGHYYAYIRTSDSPQWYLFNDDSVKEDLSKNAIEENFGEDNSEHQNYSSYGRYYGGGSYKKSYCAYMLVYIKKDEVEKIFQPISNEEVPSHLLKFLEEDKIRKQKKLIEKESIKINIISEDDIKNNTLMGLNGYEPKIEDQFLKLNKNQKVEDLYHEVSKLLNKGSSEIRLWRTSYNKVPSKVLKVSSDESLWNELNKNSYYQTDYNIFVQNKNENDEVEIDKDFMMIFIKFFFKKAGTASPIQYIGSKIVSKNSTIDSIFSYINSLLSYPEDTKLDVYREDIDNTISKLNPENQFRIIKNGGIIILQLQDEDDLKTTFNLLDPIPVLKDKNKDEEDEEEDQNTETQMPIIKYSDVLSIKKTDDIENYFNEKNNIIELKLYDYKNIKAQIAKIQILSTLSFDDLYLLISKAANLDYDSQKDTLLVYKKDYSKDKPAKEPIRKKNSYSIYNTLSCLANSKKVYYRLIKDIKEDEFDEYEKYQIQYSEDGINITFQKTIFSENKLTPKDLLEKLNITYETNKFRYFQIAKHQYQKKIKEDETILNNLYYDIRIEKIPEDQQEIHEDEKIIFIVFYKVKPYYSYSTPCGNPFIFKIIKNEKFADTKKRLLEKLNDNYKNQILKYEIEVSNEKSNYLKAKKVVNDEIILFDVLNKKDELCVVFKSKESSYEQSVKIFN